MTKPSATVNIKNRHTILQYTKTALVCMIFAVAQRKTFYIRQFMRHTKLHLNIAKPMANGKRTYAIKHLTVTGEKRFDEFSLMKVHIVRPVYGTFPRISLRIASDHHEFLIQ